MEKQAADWVLREEEELTQASLCNIDSPMGNSKQNTTFVEGAATTFLGGTAVLNT
jgi:hypothetical protein